jgi:hypothetical protein
MANGYFPKYLAACHGGAQTLDLAAGLTLVLVDAGYVYDAAHEFLDDVPGAAIVAQYPLEGVAIAADGEITADDDAAAFPALAGDDVVEALLVRDTGSDATSRLVARWTSASGLPLVPTGDDVGVVWPDGFVARLGQATS